MHILVPILLFSSPKLLSHLVSLTGPSRCRGKPHQTRWMVNSCRLDPRWLAITSKASHCFSGWSGQAITSHAASSNSTRLTFVNLGVGKKKWRNKRNQNLQHCNIWCIKVCLGFNNNNFPNNNNNKSQTDYKISWKLIETEQCQNLVSSVKRDFLDTKLKDTSVSARSW